MNMIPTLLLGKLMAEPLRVICAWHPGFDPTDPANAGASHTMCPDCEARAMAEMDAALVR